MADPIRESSFAYEGEPYVFTSTGRRFYLNAPEFYIDDIAHALCNNVRFNGHIKFPYSIGQHSMLVTDIADLLAETEDKQLCLEALLHDSTEAYLSDIPAPFKQLLPDWRAIDAHLESAMRYQFGLPQERHPLVTKADWLALFMEAELLLPSGVADAFKDPHDLREEALDMMYEEQLHEDIVPMRLERDVHNFWQYFGDYRNA